MQEPYKDTDIAKLEGNTQGLKPSQIKALQRLYTRRYTGRGGFSTEQARELASLSRSTGRQIGLLISRQGRPSMVLVGDTSGILIPELPRSREGAGRLRGLRFLHTHLTTDLLSQEDYMDMLFLRFDSIAVLSVNELGEPLEFQYAHLLPPNPEKRPYMVSSRMRWDAVDVDFSAEAEALEEELARTITGSDEPERRADRTLAQRSGVRQARLTGHAEGRGPESRAILVSVSTRSRKEQESSLDELAELADTAGVHVAGTLIQRVHTINPRFILGK